MTSRSPSADPVQQMRIMAFAYFGAAVALFVVLLILAGGWDTTDGDLARLGSWLAAITGIAGLGGAIWWRNHVGRAPLSARRLRTSWFIVVALAEIGMILGLAFALISQSLTPFAIGGGIFAVALLITVLAIGEAELEA